MLIRPRRNRSSEAIRSMVQETRLHTDNLLYPLFLTASQQDKLPIASMPGQYRLGLTPMLKKIEEALQLGIKAFAVFPVVPEHLKDEIASYSYAQDNFYIKALATIKENFPEIVLMTDVAMDPYSVHGHDGLWKNNAIVNDETLPILAKMAIAQAQAGADWIGPSDMMDGRVKTIRESLDQNGFEATGIISYTAKYASAFYGPFRDALDSAPKFGDKKTYQMNPANQKEALKEALLDTSEGADVLMVKPALAYLDVIHLLKQNTNLPVAAYQVSGEYAMLHAAAAQGWLDLEKTMLETLTAIHRAGADIILSYFAIDAAKALKA